MSDTTEERVEGEKKTLNDYLESETPTLVDFTAEWCGPCKVMKPILQDLKNSIGTKATILQIDVDRNPKLASEYRIQAVPTLIVFKAGEVMWRQSGVVQASALENILEQHYTTA